MTVGPGRRSGMRRGPGNEPHEIHGPAGNTGLHGQDGSRDLPSWRKVRFLSSPNAYDPRPKDVRVVETHMAWVFLTDREAYKLKKPVRHPFLDFGSIAAREADCREEIRLNRRLAPDVYLGLVPLTSDRSGRLALDGQGAVVDWLVRMRRLPSEHMLDQAIGRGGPARRDVERLADLLAGFYLAQEPAADMGAEAYIGRFRSQHALNMDILERFGDIFDGQRLRETASAVENFLDSGRRTLEARVGHGRIVDGHGDLRPEHICLVEPPAVIDCLEFNRYLRLVDPFDDIAYLSLECAMLGAEWIGEVVGQRVEARLQDHPSRALVAFYTVFRALLRARLALAHLIEPDDRPLDRWPRLAQAYLEAARRACEPLALDQLDH